MRRTTLAVLLVLTLGLAGCTAYGSGGTPDDGGSGEAPAGGAENSSGSTPAVERVSGVSPDRTIDLNNYDFTAVNPQIGAGTVVRFQNVQGSHTVTLDTAGIDVALSGSESVLLQFNEAGTYQVYCKYHGGPGSGMHSDVQVG